MENNPKHKTTTKKHKQLPHKINNFYKETDLMDLKKQPTHTKKTEENTNDYKDIENTKCPQQDAKWLKGYNSTTEITTKLYKTIMQKSTNLHPFSLLLLLLAPV